jgi:HAD superfamily hydrolase (TIGR01549 family)
MINSFLFDLDDTLLPYAFSQEVMIEALIESGANFYSQWIPPDQYIPAFAKSLEAMDDNRRGNLTNFEEMSTTFSSIVDFPVENIKQAAIDYYQTEFNNLKYLANPSSFAREIMDLFFKYDSEVVIATGFQAPRVAAEVRLDWAGIPVTDYDYRFIATWDNMHSSKPHIEFYQEILDHIDREAGECLFVGDSWEDEIIPATKLGILSYWVVDPTTEIPEDLDLLAGYGQLAQLHEWLLNLFV